MSSAHTLRAVYARSRKNLWERAPGWLRQCAAPALGSLPAPLLLGRRFREWRRFLHRAERWPAERCRAYQVAQLRRICALAARAPFWREQFRAAGFDPRDLREIEDLRGLPTIDRHTIAARGADMCTRDPHAPGVDYVSTNGTGGRPLSFYIDAARSAVEYAHLVASWARVGYELGQPQALLRGRVVPRRGGMHYEYDAVLRRHVYSTFHMSDAEMARYVEHMRGIGPSYLHVYPSSLAILTRFLLRRGAETPDNIRGILAGSETVYEADRALAERVWGVRWFSWYGHSEKLVLAAECEHSRDYHVWPTYGHFELLDGDGRPVERPGESGEIVGTGFINTVLPFIRYRTGDRATLVGWRCDACGREHPLIRDVRGHRTHEMLVVADGALVPWTAVNTHDDTFAGVRQFQFVQDTPGEAVLRIVPADGFEPADERRVLARLHARLDGRLRLRIERTTDIPLAGRGKTIYVDQRLDLEALERGGQRR